MRCAYPTRRPVVEHKDISTSEPALADHRGVQLATVVMLRLVDGVGGLTASQVRRAMEFFRDALGEHREELNRLNVFPVPDGDTGRNLWNTSVAVCAELTSAHTMADVCQGMYRGGLFGGRGHSGVIAGSILRALAEEWRDLESIDARSMATALRRAADEAHKSELTPIQGTILTLARDAAVAAERAVDAGVDDVPQLLKHVVEEAELALARTQQTLAVLRRAGVVDAGALGLTLLLSAFLRSSEECVE